MTEQINITPTGRRWPPVPHTSIEGFKAYMRKWGLWGGLFYAEGKIYDKYLAGANVDDCKFALIDAGFVQGHAEDTISMWNKVVAEREHDPNSRIYVHDPSGHRVNLDDLPDQDEGFEKGPPGPILAEYRYYGRVDVPKHHVVVHKVTCQYAGQSRRWVVSKTKKLLTAWMKRHGYTSADCKVCM